MYSGIFNMPYLKACELFWYDKRLKAEDVKCDCYVDCYAITSDYFTYGAYIRPEFENISQAKRHEIFGKSQHIISELDGNFKLKEIPRKIIDFFEEQLARTTKFFEKVNNGEVPIYKRATCRIGPFAVLYKDFESPIVYVNAEKYLDPALNLLYNLMSDSSLSDNDEIRFYFDEDDNVVYIAWYEAESNRNYWTMGLKPIAIKDGKYIKKAFHEIYLLFAPASKSQKY